MLPGETRTSGAPAPPPCDICGGTNFPLAVWRSSAGYYIGTACAGCGQPESRETGYFRRREEAESALARMKHGDLSDTRAVEAGMVPGIRSGGVT